MTEWLGVDFEVERYADLVFHVLSHVPSDVPASLHDPRYVAYSAEHLGPAEERLLGADLGVFASVARDHERYARLQALAWLFATPDDEARAAAQTLVELSDDRVSEPRLLAGLRRFGPEIEVLRASAALEREHHERLPPFAVDRSGLGRALERVSAAAPELHGFRIGLVRSLGLRGRVRGSAIWVGVPGFELGPTPAHAAWQAAHEATVAELSATVRGQGTSDRPLEQAALVLLAGRAARAGLHDEHAAWLSHWERVPPLEQGHLPEPFRSAVRARLERGLPDT